MLIKEAKSLKKINLPKYCSHCGVKRSEYWHAILSCETPTDVELYEDDDNRMPQMSGYKNYILCDKCSEQYNKMSEVWWIRGPETPTTPRPRVAIHGITTIDIQEVYIHRDP